MLPLYVDTFFVLWGALRKRNQHAKKNYSASEVRFGRQSVRALRGASLIDVLLFFHRQLEEQMPFARFSVAARFWISDSNAWCIRVEFSLKWSRFRSLLLAA